MSKASKSELSQKTKISESYSSNLSGRHRFGRISLVVFQASTLIGIVALTALAINIIDSSFGYAAVQYSVDPETLAVDGVPLNELPKEELQRIFQENVSKGLYRRYESEIPFEERSKEDVYNLVQERVVAPESTQTWGLVDSLTKIDEIIAEAKEKYPESELQFVSWLTTDFIRNPQSSVPEKAGVRTAILGSLFTIAVTGFVAFPLGVFAAIYLEEYASDNRFNRVIRTNINNLAGVPSIIYGILGLAIFVRAMEALTSGTLFGVIEDPTTANGRTIISAGLTLAMLILPLIIINGQEAIRAVPNSLRQASLGLGATKWQTIWHHVLPNALPGILTGAILAISRAFGETAPLVVVGASTFITVDPTGLFSKFTILPIQT